MKPSGLHNSLRSVHEISQGSSRNSSVINEYKNKVDQNLHIKEKCIELQTQLKMTKEQLELQHAEFSFQRSEYLSEIESLKSIEAELRKKIFELTEEKNRVIKSYEIKLQQAITNHENEQKEALEQYNSDLEKLRAENIALQVAQEVIDAENRRLSRQNDELMGHVKSQNEIANKRIEVVKGRLDGDSELISSLRQQIIDITKNYDGQVAELQTKVLEEQTKAGLHYGNLQVAEEKTKNLENQLNILRKRNTDLSNEIIQKTSEISTLSSLVDQLKNEKSVIEIGANKDRQIAVHAENKLSMLDSVSSCSPINRQRINIMKVFVNDWNKVEKDLFVFTEVRLRDLIFVVYFAQKWLNMLSDKAVANSGGLGYFKPASRYDLRDVFRRLSRQLQQYKTSQSENAKENEDMRVKLEKVKTKSKRRQVVNEAQALELKTMIKCNNILHRHMTLILPEEK